MKIGCCIDIEYYDIAAETGYEFINLPGKSVYAMNSEEFENAKSKILNGPIPCPGVNSYCPADIILAGPGYDTEKIHEYGNFTVQRLSQLGVKSLSIGCPNSRKLPEGFDRNLAIDQMCQTLKITCEIAKHYNMEVYLEALSTWETNFLNTTNECLEIINKLNIDNLNLVYDVYHVAMMKESPDDFKKALNYIKYAHISYGADGLRTYINNDSTGIYKPYADNLLSPMYSGDVAVEVFFGDHENGLKNSYGLLKELFKRE